MHARERAISSPRLWKASGDSSGVGLLSGGAQRTAAAMNVGDFKPSLDGDVVMFENRAMQRGHQKIARATVPSPVNSTGRFARVRLRKANQQHARVRIAKPRNRLRPIRLIAKRATFFASDPFTVLTQPRTFFAGDDLLANNRQIKHDLATKARRNIFHNQV